MSLSDFWKLLADSRLLSAAHVQRLATDFQKEKPPSDHTVKTAAQWLMDLRAISKYQAQVLVTGKTGPFFFGDYKLYERIDKGRLTGCFRALHNASKYCVILRFATGAILKDPQQWAAASENAALATQIVSPFVQRCFEAADLTRFKFIVSEDVRGGGLEEALTANGGKLPPAEACRLMRQVALGLAAMHSAGRTHGDLRPANVLLETFGNQPANVKLIYDVASLPTAFDSSQLQEGSRLALLADYLAPELLVAGRAPDPLSDIYGLGAILYALLTGKPPFAGGDVQQKLKRQLSEPARPLETMGVPQPLAQLVSYLMAKNPSVRYQSAAQVADQLALFVPPASLSSGPPPPPPTLALYEQYLQKKSAPAVKPSARPQPASAAISQTASPTAPGKTPGNDDRTQAIAAPPAGEFSINTQPPPRTSSAANEIAQRRKAQQNRNLLVVGITGLALLAFIVLGGTLFLLTRSKSSSKTIAKVEPTTPAAVPADSQKTVNNGADKSAPPGGDQQSPASGDNEPAAIKIVSSSIPPIQQVVKDDGKLLWASPTRGKPTTFRCVPPEGEVFIIIRPAAMLASDEGRRVIAALGPSLVAEQQAFEKASGCNFDEIEQLHITLHDSDGKFPRFSYVVKTSQPLSKLELLARWGDPEVAKVGNEAYYTGGATAYYISKSPDDERTFAMGAARDMKEVAAAGGEPPPVFRDMERLRRLTDSDRHFTVLFYPQFLFQGDGQQLFVGERARIKDSLAWLLGDYVQAASFSAYFADEFYFEARLRGSLDREPNALAADVRERLDEIPRSLEDYFVTLNAPPFWKKLAFRYPGMVRELHNQIRIGVENEIAMINAVLPTTAAHNLVLGGELLMSTAPGQVALASNSGGAAPAASGPQTLADALQIKTSYNFDNQSLEFAMRDLADDVHGNLKNAPFAFAIKIIGDDLKLDGITRNQSIRDFKQENQTVADILTALVRKANPVTTVKDPSEKDQKLVWCIGPDPDSPGKQVVLITTRSAANAKKYTLPPNFVEKGGKK
jgi:serine/threonine protein kinase